MTNSTNNKNKQLFNKAKPYKWVTINNKKTRVEIVEELPKGYVYVKDYCEYALFTLKTMFVDDNQYVLILKKTVKNTKEKKV